MKYAGFHGERQPLLRGQRTGDLEVALGQLRLVAIEGKHRGETKSTKQRERMANTLRQRQSTADTCEGLLEISDQPLRASANATGADSWTCPP
jgi:hypothetical protein